MTLKELKAKRKWYRQEHRDHPELFPTRYAQKVQYIKYLYQLRRGEFVPWIGTWQGIDVAYCNYYAKSDS